MLSVQLSHCGIRHLQPDSLSGEAHSFKALSKEAQSLGYPSHPLPLLPYSLQGHIIKYDVL